MIANFCCFSVHESQEGQVCTCFSVLGYHCGSSKNKTVMGSKILTGDCEDNAKYYCDSSNAPAAFIQNCTGGCVDDPLRGSLECKTTP